MNKTVYIVTSGSYSDYHICEVFLNEEKALSYCATKNLSIGDYDDPFYIEKFDAYDDNIEIDKNKKIYKSGSIYLDIEHDNIEIDTEIDIDHIISFHPEDNNGNIKALLSPSFYPTRYRYYYSVETNISDEKLKKIAKDAVMKYIAEQKSFIKETKSDEQSMS